MKGIVRIAAVAMLCVTGWTVGAVSAPSHARACPIGPGTSTCAPDSLTVSASATWVQGSSGTLNTCATQAPPCFIADWVENVYREPGPNALGCTGCLTWVWQLSDRQITQSPDLIARVNIGNFAHFLTDIGVETNTPPPGNPPFTGTGTNLPNNVERGGNGDVLRWDFNCAGPPNSCSPPNEIGPGMGTVLLEAETDALYVVPGTVSAQNGTAASQPALGPTTPDAIWVPALGIIGGAVAGGFAFRRRRNRNRGSEESQLLV